MVEIRTATAIVSSMIASGTNNLNAPQLYNAMSKINYIVNFPTGIPNMGEKAPIGVIIDHYKNP
jgi:hypothetical protein